MDLKSPTLIVQLHVEEYIYKVCFWYMDKLVSQEALSCARRRQGRCKSSDRNRAPWAWLVRACTSWATRNETSKWPVRAMPLFANLNFKFQRIFCLNNCDLTKRVSVNSNGFLFIWTVVTLRKKCWKYVLK